MSDLLFCRPMLQRILRQSELMDRMLAHVGVDPAAAMRIDRGMAWYEARSRCIACNRDRDCRDWLRSADGPAEPAEFSPNARFFSLCRHGSGCEHQGRAPQAERLLGSRGSTRV
jgi:hypothetical protein